ncbi:hypothetical protein Q5752_000222 [Cryptotrichosporon argae]
MATQPSMGLDLRLLALEASVFGVPPSYHDSADAQRKRAGPSRARARSPERPVTVRVDEARSRLEGVVKDSDALKSLWVNYDRYLPFLKLDDDPALLVKDGVPAPPDAPQPGPADFVGAHTRLALVLESARDIADAERQLREIDVLRARGVDGAGELEAVLPLRGNLALGQDRLLADEAALGALRTDVVDLLRRYGDYTAAASDMFLELHARLSALEDAAGRLERRKRAEHAATY